MIETHDSRLTALRFDSCKGPLLLMCVYMPTDGGDHDCFENYCCRIDTLYSDADVVHALIGGDFNCQIGSCFYDLFCGWLGGNPYYNYNTRSNMQHASSKSASRNKQVATEHITTARKAATWAQLGVVSYLSIKQLH